MHWRSSHSRKSWLILCFSGPIKCANSLFSFLYLAEFLLLHQYALKPTKPLLQKRQPSLKPTSSSFPCSWVYFWTFWTAFSLGCRALKQTPFIPGHGNCGRMGWEALTSHLWVTWVVLEPNSPVQPVVSRQWCWEQEERGWFTARVLVDSLRKVFLARHTTEWKTFANLALHFFSISYYVLQVTNFLGIFFQWTFYSLSFIAWRSQESFSLKVQLD